MADSAYGIIIDSTGTADFNPGSEVDHLTSNGWYDPFLCKYDY